MLLTCPGWQLSWVPGSQVCTAAQVAAALEHPSVKDRDSRQGHPLLWVTAGTAGAGPVRHPGGASAPAATPAVGGSGCIIQSGPRAGVC
jgi:hypothetical protein